ncbi:RagB/SusD family nutrient uptake outer membrane protein [Olivibacter sitiensis]|uniref:RagB/SusD family nutrient uptake outer membrane protein n=1 Tax=Olivibacter sitiensis TaxID=376470 RepID=UPI0003F94D7C|nr:RagB/SusD family nutrient uptake outer membrane protein [Olivibacter sitiensis]
MKKISIYFVSLLLASLTACESKLDIKPLQNLDTEVALSSSANIQNLLNGGYERAGRSGLFGGYLQVASELYGSTNEIAWNGTWTAFGEIFNKAILVNNTYVEGIWLNAYYTINIANLVIDHIDVVDEDERNRVLGEAKFLRALSYFELVRNFGSQYGAGGGNSQLGVPLILAGVLDYSGDLTAGRNSVSEVYAQVLLDLNDAYTLLPSDNGIYASKFAAQALLARVYLQQGDYAAALASANDVIENSDAQLTSTYAAAFNNNTNSTEDLFAFQVSSQAGSNSLITLYADQDNGGRGGDIHIQAGFINLFDSETDVRSSFLYTSANYANRRLTAKYTNQFANVTVLRLAEMYLIRAESNLRLGSQTGGTPLADINAIRGRANASLKSSVTIDDVILERRLELAFEGFLIHDYKRTGRAVGNVPANSESLVFPIPQREMDVNPLLEQNPGYGS